MRETLYGRNAVCESLKAGRRKFYKLTLAEGIQETDTVHQILFLAEQAGVPIVRTDRRSLDRFGDFTHQGVVLEASEYPYVFLDDTLELAQSRNEPPLLLLLDLLQDPQNVGGLLRTAEVVGVHGVAIQQRRAVGITPAVVNSSAGAVEHLLVAQETNLVQAIGRLKDHRVWVAGLEATRGAQQYDQADLSGALALVVGSEGQGMRRLVQEQCDFLVELPVRGNVTSLNAAIAGSVVLYEVLRQRRAAQA